jgi:hypothetical protein
MEKVLKNGGGGRTCNSEDAANDGAESGQEVEERVFFFLERHHDGREVIKEENARQPALQPLGQKKVGRKSQFVLNSVRLCLNSLILVLNMCPKY